MKWQDFIFGRKPLADAAGQPQPQQQQEGNAGLDIGRMAQDQANKMKVTAMGGPAGQIINSFRHPATTGAPQPTMQQLCPHCGK